MQIALIDNGIDRSLVDDEEIDFLSVISEGGSDTSNTIMV